MTIVDEGRSIRGEVARLRPDKRRRYSDELRRRILDWVSRAVASGMAESECSKALGVKTWRFRTWRRAAATEPQTLALVGVGTTTVAITAVALVTPRGYRIEGLALDEVVGLLRELA